MNWYYINCNQQLGPVDDIALSGLIRSNHVTRVTPVWNENMKDWMPAASTQLATLFDQTQKSTWTPQPPPPVVPTTTKELPYHKEARWRKQRKILGLIMFVLGITGFCFGVYPSGAGAGVGFWMMISD